MSNFCPSRLPQGSIRLRSTIQTPAVSWEKKQFLLFLFFFGAGSVGNELESPFSALVQAFQGDTGSEIFLVT
jgi:hypothetical protein